MICGLMSPIQTNITFGLMSLGLMSFGLISFGLYHSTIQNSQTRLGPWKWAHFVNMGLFQSRYLVLGPLESAHLPNIKLLSLANPVNFSLFHICYKSYSIFTSRRTGEIFCTQKFIPFITVHSYICFAHSFTSIVKDNNIFIAALGETRLRLCMELFGKSLASLLHLFM